MGHIQITPVLLSGVERSPDASTGMSQVLPCQGPAGRACVLSRIRTVATMSLSATGSRKAPNADTVPYNHSATLKDACRLHAPACSVHTMKTCERLSHGFLGWSLGCHMPRQAHRPGGGLLPFATVRHHRPADRQQGPSSGAAPWPHHLSCQPAVHKVSNACRNKDDAVCQRRPRLVAVPHCTGTGRSWCQKW